MAIIRYNPTPRRVTPSATNIVRAQTTPSPPQGPALNPATGKADYLENVIKQTSTPTPPPIDINKIVSDALTGIDFGLNWPTVTSGGGTSGGGSSQSALINANTAAQKLLFDQAQAAAQARAGQEVEARARLGIGAQAGALQNLLSGTGYREGADALLALLAEQETAGRESIANQYAAAQKLLEEQYGRATGQTTAGYDALRNYLQANAPQAYAQTQAAPAPKIVDVIAQFAAGQGVTPTASTEEVAAQNAAAQAGLGNYQGLLDILRRQETAGQASRLAEQEMARTTAGTALEARRAQAGAGLTQQQQTALDTLVNQLTGQRFGVEQGATQRKESLQDALTALLGTGYNVTGEQIAKEIETSEVPAVSQSNPNLAKNRTATTDWQKLVQGKHPNFTGTWNEAKKKFPKLYKQYLDSQKKKK